jgi:thymidylate synthase (FAD)
VKIINPSFEIVSPGENSGVGLLQHIERMARISHRSEDKQTEDSWRKFIPAIVMQHGDWSVVEHAGATVVFRVNRGVTHELVRHRLFSFTQESTRFVNGRKSYPNGLEFIESADGLGTHVFTFCENAYLNLLDEGIRPQEARSVLPNALAATIAVTGNLRNWRHFFLMRTSKETHPDFRRVTIPLLAEFKTRIPILYDDIEPEARQIDNLKKAR